MRSLSLSRLTQSKSCLIGDTIEVYVGPKSKRYGVHKALLTQHEWFSKKIPSHASHLDLPAEDPKVFELLISWLYRKILKAICTTDEKVAEEEAILYINTYLRACEWEMQGLQNALMDRMRVRTTCTQVKFSKDLIKSIYRTTQPLSPLRSYMVDTFIYECVEWDVNGTLIDPNHPSFVLTRKIALKIQLNAGNQEFVLDCYEALFQLCAKSKIPDPACKTGCVYHTHKEGEMCMR